MSEEIKLTQFAHGGGCGCKIAPKVLEEILRGSAAINDPRILVGNGTNDDAAVYDLGNNTALISTTDFFTPIIDDAFDFGRIAAANAISDVYAMGGKPLFALAILGWPIEKLPAALATRVLEGARAICGEAEITIAGGHTIDSSEPIFGLAVSGMVAIDELKRNNTAKEGDVLFLTKPLGTGIISAAQKRGSLNEEHLPAFLANITRLNSVGNNLGKVKGVNAMTDITGFGVLGHLIEMAQGSGLSAEIYYSQLQLLPGVKEYLAQRIVPDATYRNWNSYSTLSGFSKGVNVMEAFNVLPDPQTNGGLLISVDPESVDEVTTILLKEGYENFIDPIGRMIAKSEKTVHVT